MAQYTVDDQFIGKAPDVRAIYDRLLAQVQAFGPVIEEPKKTSIHLSNKSAFAGVHTRKDYLLVTIRSDHPIESPRVVKAERASKNRYHQDIKLAHPDDVDADLLTWLKAAYSLSG